MMFYSQIIYSHHYFTRTQPWVVTSTSGQALAWRTLPWALHHYSKRSLLWVVICPQGQFLAWRTASLLLKVPTMSSDGVPQGKALVWGLHHYSKRSQLWVVICPQGLHHYSTRSQTWVEMVFLKERPWPWGLHQYSKRSQLWVVIDGTKDIILMIVVVLTAWQGLSWIKCVHSFRGWMLISRLCYVKGICCNSINVSESVRSGFVAEVKVLTWYF